MKCKNCKAEFTPFRSIENWCSPQCGYELAKKNLIKGIDKKNAAKKKEIQSISGLQKDMQPTFNKIARFIDYEQPCISCGSFGKPQGGHYHASTNIALRFNLHNIFGQCYRCNVELSSNRSGFIRGLISIYGASYWSYVDEDLMQMYPILKLDKESLNKAWSEAREIARLLERNPRKYNPQERENLRTEFNNRIGIYKELI